MLNKLKQILIIIAVIAAPLLYILGFVTHPIYTIIGTGIYLGILKIAVKELNRYGRIAAKFGKAKVFTGVKWFNGDPITAEQYGIIFSIMQIPVVLNSDQGPVMVIHGIPDYDKGFWSGFKSIGHRWLSRLVPGGSTYWLVSCHNAYHGNYMNPTRAVGFIRPIPSISKQVCFCDFDEKEKTLTVYTGKRIAGLETLALPGLLYFIPVMKWFYSHFTPYKYLWNKARNEQIQIGLLKGELKPESQVTDTVLKNTMEQIKSFPSSRK